MKFLKMNLKLYNKKGTYKFLFYISYMDSISSKISLKSLIRLPKLNDSLENSKSNIFS